MRKMTAGIIVSLLLLLAWSGRGKAETEQEADRYQTYMDELDLQSIQNTVDELLPQDHLNFRQMITKLCQGEIPLSGDTFVSLTENTLFFELKRQRTTIVQILILAMTASVFSVFMSAFTGSRVQEIAFYMVYLLLFVILLDSFRELSSISEQTMQSVLQFMRLLLPVYLLAASLAATQMTAIGFYEVTLFIIMVVQSVVQYVLMPGIACYVLIAMLGNVTKEAYLTRMTALIRQIVRWSLKTMLTLVIGIQTIQRLLFPALDHMKNSIWIRAGGAIPVVGNTLSSVTETLLGTASVLKHAVGTGGMILLIWICLRPLVRLLACLLLYKLVSAMIQPVADPRFVRCIDDMAEAVGLLLLAVAVTGVMFFLTIAIVTTAGG